jgi:RecA-family ATPase
MDLAEIWSRDPDPIDFVLPGLAVGTVGAIVSAGGVGKTFAMLQTALAIAIGRDVGNLWGSEPKQGRAVYLSLEDPPAVLAIRLHALRQLIPPGLQSLVVENLSVIPGAGEGLAIKTARSNDVELSDWFEAFQDELVRQQPRLVVIDTFNRLLNGVSENDAGLMGWVLQQVEVLANRARCAVIVCHHVSKAAALTGKAGDEAHAARGSSVITDNARWVVNLATRKEKDAGDAPTGVTLAFTKINYGPPKSHRLLVRATDGTLSEKSAAAAASVMAGIPSA